MSKANLGKKYVGLTDDPVRRKAEHGFPPGWMQNVFSGETEARTWESRMLLMGCVGGTGGAGWQFGYIYTITSQTNE